VSRWYLEDKGIHKEMFAAMTREEISFLSPSLYVCTYTVHHMRQGCVVPVQLLMNTARRHQGGAGAAWLATQAASILQLYQLSWPCTRRIFACLLYQDVWLADQSLCTYRLRFFFFGCCFWLALGCGVALVPPGLCSSPHRCAIAIGGGPFRAYGCDREDVISRTILATLTRRLLLLLTRVAADSILARGHMSIHKRTYIHYSTQHSTAPEALVPTRILSPVTPPSLMPMRPSPTHW
jgi:hypothetical protein